VPLPSLQLPNVPETRLALPNPYIARELRAFQPDLIHICSPALMSISGVWAGRNMDVPIVANYQTDLPGFARLYGLDVAALLMQRWLRYIHNSCHVTLVPSKHTEAQIRAHGIRRISRWGRGVDIRRFNPAHRSEAWRARLLDGRDPESLLCVYVGRLATEKCIEQLVEVARLPGVALTIIGDGAQREELETIFAGTGTVFTGYLLGDELPAAFASADVFVFTGPSETFGQVVQEAMASGLPSVVTDSGGVADLVIPGETGFHAAPDPADFADKVRRLRDDSHLRAQMGQTARAIAEERPWEKTLAGLEPIWSEAVALNERYIRRYGPVRQQFRLPLP
jgi:phosphatidylinositol alpha 1,6-mannosyltransferase